MKSISLIALLFWSCCLPHLSFSAQPNLLLIIADDLNCELGCYGNALVHSPNLDRLATRGVKFDRAFCQYPLCNPSRTSIMTGLRPETLGTTAMGNSVEEVKLPEGATIIGAWLRGHGYFSAKAGKIFHGEKYTNTWDEALAWSDDEDVNAGARTKLKRTPWFALPPKMKQVNGQQKKVGESLVCATLDVGDEQTSDGQIAREGAKLLERASQTGKPFFVAVGFHAPHLPLVAPKKYFELYDPAKIPLADEPLDALQAIPPTALVSSGTTERPLTPDERRQVIAAYYAMIAYLDAQAGLLLDALDRLKLTDNTLVIFTSDHGFHLGDHGGLWSKKTLFDAAVRVPLIIAGPGVVRGHSSPRLVELVDLFPTIAEMTATGTPPKLEGRSLSPLLSDPQAPRDRPARTVVINNERSSGVAVRTERFTYVEWNDGQRGVELYDRTKDPQELRNLAAEPSQAPAVKTMKAILHP